MARAVEAVAAHLVLLVVAVGDAVHEGVLRHGLVEGGVEHAHLRDVGQGLQDRLDPHDVGRVVQWRQGHAALHGLQDLRVDLDGGREVLAPVNDAVADSGELVKRGEHAVAAPLQRVQHQLDRDLVVRDGRLLDQRFQPRLRVLDLGAVDTDPLHQPLGQNGLVVHVEELILQGGTAAVDDENFHFLRYLPFKISEEGTPEPSGQRRPEKTRS